MPSIPKIPPWWPQTPHYRQALALWGYETIPDLLFGGAAGPGKSSYLLMAGSQYCHVPDFRGLLIRKTYQDLSLPGALLDRGQEWWHDRYGIRYKSQEHTFVWPSGAEITFGHLGDSGAHQRYQGAELDFIGIDEASQIPEQQLRYLYSRLRRSVNSELPTRYRLASNPGGTSHDYLKREFVRSTNPDRVFLPARLTDNPHLDIEDYRKRLSNLDPITRRMLEDGDWDASFSTGFFETDQIDVIDVAPEGLEILRAWDFAATVPHDNNPDPDYTAGVKLGITIDKRFVILDIVHVRQGPAAVQTLLRSTAESDTAAVRIYAEEEPGSAGKFVNDQLYRLLSGYSYRGIRSTGSKLDRAKPFAGAMANGMVSILSSCPHADTLITELRQFPAGTHDDLVDALSLGCEQLVANQRVLEWTFI